MEPTRRGRAAQSSRLRVVAASRCQSESERDARRTRTRGACTTKMMAWALLALFICAIELRAQDPKSTTNTFFLPKNPVAAAYILGRLSNKELIEAPRSEFVYVALLQRKGLERKYRLEALDGLARLRNTDRLTELLKAFGELDRKGEEVQPLLEELSGILMLSSRDELNAKRDALQTLAVEGQLPVTRQIAYAALITADGAADPVWKQAEPDADRLADVFFAIPRLRDAKLRQDFFSRAEPLVRQSNTPQLQRAAIAAIASIPGREPEVFQLLSSLVSRGIERAVAISGLQRIPKKFWPKDAAEPLVRTLIGQLEHVPSAERTTDEFTAALQLATELTTLLPKEAAAAFSKTLRALGPVVVTIRAVYEQMLYDTQLIVVEPGKTVHITFENPDAMPHNVVVTTPGALEEIGQAAEKMAPEPDAQGRLYVPDSPKVLHATKMVDPGQKTTLTFTAPETPGEYPYVCTFPGHWRRMTGLLAVVNDVDAYLAARAASEPKVTEWKVEDLAGDLAQVAAGRNLEQGSKFYTQLGCAQCHRLGKEGAAYGPDLTGILAKWKGDRAALLAQIVEPSQVIEERYKTYEFVLEDGDSVFGMILREEGETIVVQAGPAENQIQTIKKSDIAERKAQSSSVMPIGLLNTLSKEQILDLLAFIESGGATPPHVHNH